jgi:hypothetical protein
MAKNSAAHEAHGAGGRGAGGACDAARGGEPGEGARERVSEWSWMHRGSASAYRVA